jgi:hypothetical protein
VAHDDANGPVGQIYWTSPRRATGSLPTLLSSLSSPSASAHKDECAGLLLLPYEQLKLEDEQDPNPQHNLGRMLELSVPAPEAARRGGGQAR